MYCEQVYRYTLTPNQPTVFLTKPIPALLSSASHAFPPFGNDTDLLYLSQAKGSFISEDCAAYLVKILCCMKKPVAFHWSPTGLACWRETVGLAYTIGHTVLKISLEISLLSHVLSSDKYCSTYWFKVGKCVSCFCAGHIAPWAALANVFKATEVVDGELVWQMLPPPTSDESAGGCPQHHHIAMNVPLGQLN